MWRNEYTILIKFTKIHLSVKYFSFVGIFDIIVVDHSNPHQNPPHSHNIRSSSPSPFDVGSRYDGEMQMTSSSAPTATYNGTHYENSRPLQMIMTSETTSVITTRDDDVNTVTLTSQSETVVDKVRTIRPSLREFGSKIKYIQACLDDGR